MKVLLTTHLIVTVDDEEEAGSIGLRVAKGVEDGMKLSLMEFPGVEEEDVAGLVAFLGVTVSVIPEQVIA